MFRKHKEKFRILLRFLEVYLVTIFDTKRAPPEPTLYVLRELGPPPKIEIKSGPEFIV